MKTIKQLCFVFIMLVFVYACKNENNQKPSTVNETETATKKTGQAFIKDDEGTPNYLQIAISSPDHKTNLPEGTVENLVKPENKAALANILKYHVTPGNLSTSILT